MTNKNDVNWMYVCRFFDCDLLFTLVKSSRIYTGQYTFPILLLNDDNVLGEHNWR